MKTILITLATLLTISTAATIPQKDKLTEVPQSVVCQQVQQALGGKEQARTFISPVGAQSTKANIDQLGKAGSWAVQKDWSDIALGTLKYFVVSDKYSDTGLNLLGFLVNGKNVCVIYISTPTWFLQNGVQASK